MLAAKYTFFLIAGNVGIYLCCGYGAVTEYMLDIAYIHIVFQKICGKGMPEHMGSYMLFYAAFFCVGSYHKSCRLLGKPVTQPVCKKILG